jgi:hypothetical protein
MKQVFLTAIFLLVANLCGCAKDHSTGDSGTPAEALPAAPQSWISGGGASASVSSSGFPAPSADFTASVQSSFQAHTAALESINPHLSGLVLSPTPTGHPSDWTPWHLDGLVVGFGLDVGGVFGFLATDGSPSVKVTWQKFPAAEKPKAKSARAASVRFHSSMSNQDIAALVEPAVELAISSKRVRDSRRLRNNLSEEAARFLSFVRILRSIQPSSAWHVDGYQLSLSVGATGDIAPGLNLGGTFLVLFDWQASGETFSPSAAARMSSQELELQPEVSDFVRSVGALLPLARSSAPEIRESGFELQVFRWA